MVSGLRLVDVLAIEATAVSLGAVPVPGSVDDFEMDEGEGREHVKHKS